MTTLPPGSVIEDKATLWLNEGWRLARTPAGACKGPDELAGFPSEWHDAKVPGTVASAIHADINLPGNYDADDWWYRLKFETPSRSSTSRYRLRLDGLATLADVWLNGTHILSSRNMFVAQRVDVTALLREENHLAIRFASLDAELARRRPRPRWKTAVVAQQNLRWVRTTLLGRMPGWTPAIAPVGPWGPIALESVDRVEISALELRARAEGNVGRLEVRAAVSRLDGKPIAAARINVGGELHALAIDGEIHGDLLIPDVPLWWPHTHGAPRLVPCQLELNLDGEWHAIDCGAIGFKELALDERDGAVRFRINGESVFCRGACWTTADILALRGDPATLRRALEGVRDAGANMLRIGGTMTYESNDFYRLCDELGILVWQDFMFANMDYPFGDAAFRAGVEAEVRHQLGRFHRHACIAAYCGGSEVAQQAAMMGLAQEHWTNDFVAQALPRMCAELHPGIPYFPSSPWGGALPFHVGTGIAHYYGVGAYRRPLADVKTARVKFASECLGFSNMPEAATIERMQDGAIPSPHHPLWKARVPRDNGAGYDFEDVRDHYLKLLFGTDAVELRSQDLERYRAASRVLTGEVMACVFSEWRAPSSGCGGALVWFLRDLWAGAGWGITDELGTPKAAYWYLKRAWATQAIRITDEGLDGLLLHVLNESAEPLDAVVELEMFKAGRLVAAAKEAKIAIPARGAATLQGDALLGYFSDSTDAYRFGPAKYDAVAARLKRAEGGEVLSEDFHFPTGLDLPVQRSAGLEAVARWTRDGNVVVRVKSEAFLQSVCIACEGFVSTDNYFHLVPKREKRIVFARAAGSAAEFRAHVQALNLAEGVSLRAQALDADEA